MQTLLKWILAAGVLAATAGLAAAQAPASRQAVAEAHRIAQEAQRPMVPHVRHTLTIGPWGFEWVPYSTYLGAQPPIGHQQIQTGQGAWVSRPIYGDQLAPQPVAVAQPSPGPATVAPANLGSGAVADVPPAEPEPVDPDDPADIRSNPEALTDVAVAALRAGNLTAALEMADRALTLESQYGHAALVRAQVLFALVRFPEAVADLEWATDRLPADVWLQPVTNYAYTFGPDSKQATRRYVTWLQALEATVRTEPENVAARTLLGYHYAALGFTDAAAAHLREVLRIAPNAVLPQRLLPRLGVTVPPAAKPAGDRQF
jgi:tetratricopeptide (TPR) repeat protein